MIAEAEVEMVGRTLLQPMADIAVAVTVVEVIVGETAEAIATAEEIVVAAEGVEMEEVVVVEEISYW